MCRNSAVIANSHIMQLRNHIALRFLTDDSLAHEMLETSYPGEYGRVGKDLGSEIDVEKLRSYYEVIGNKNQKAYYITNSVIDKLDMLKVSQKNGLYDYTVFKHVEDCKITFIFKDNALLRMHIAGDTICFCHVHYTYYNKEDKIKYNAQGNSYWINFFVNRETGQQCDHFNHIDVKKIERFVYHLLCFFFLSENSELVVSPGMSYGTKKQPDALCNDTNVPVIIVNSNWNVTSIRLQGFNVCGHFRLQPYPSLGITKMIFIEPFQKHGYVRRATNEIINQ